MSSTIQIKAVYKNGAKATIIGRHNSKGIEYHIPNTVQDIDIDYQAIRGKKVKHYEAIIDLSTTHSNEHIQSITYHSNTAQARNSINSTIFLLDRIKHDTK